MHIIHIFAFIDGILMGLVASYFLLGLFFNAAWLHTDWRRGTGYVGTNFSPKPVRGFCALFLFVLAGRHFAEALYGYDFPFRHFYDASGIILAVGFLITFFYYRSKRRAAARVKSEV